MFNKLKKKKLRKVKFCLLGAFLIMFSGVFCNAYVAKWEDWELGGALELGVASGSESGRILSPVLRGTLTKNIDNRFIEIGLGYMYGSQITTNYSKDDIDEASYTQEETDKYNELINEAGQDVKIRMSIVPMTVNFYYTIYESFYVGAGAGLYHVFYKKEPLGDYRVNIDSEKGDIVKSPSTTALGFQQIVGIEIFPMSNNWKWFIGLKSFLTTAGGKAGSLLGITFGGKVRYSW